MGSVKEKPFPHLSHLSHMIPSQVIGYSPIDQKGRVSIPARVMKKMGLHNGDALVWRERGDELVVEASLVRRFREASE